VIPPESYAPANLWQAGNTISLVPVFTEVAANNKFYPKFNGWKSCVP
jgi:hypothetical protein